MMMSLIWSFSATRLFVNKIAHHQVRQLFTLPNVFSLPHRPISTSHIFRSETNNASSGDITVNFINKNGEKVVVHAKEGDNMMYLAQQNEVLSIYHCFVIYFVLICKDKSKRDKKHQFVLCKVCIIIITVLNFCFHLFIRFRLKELVKVRVYFGASKVRVYGFKQCFEGFFRLNSSLKTPFQTLF